MSDSEYSEHESENSFDKNKDNEIDNLDKLFKRMGLEHYRFQPTKKNEKSQEGSSQTQKNLRVGKIRMVHVQKL